MNRLQGVSNKQNYFISIDPQEGLDEFKILREMDYEHPLFDLSAIEAQQRFQELNATGPISFCGSYFNYDFHEDAYTSAVQLCTRLLGPEKADTVEEFKKNLVKS